MRVYLEDLVDAMDWSSDGAYLNVATGETLVINEEMEYAARMFEDLPEGASDEDVYEAFGWGWEDPEFLSLLRGEGEFLRLPDGYDIDEYRIMRHFAWSRDDDEQGCALMRAIQGRGAFRRFKDALRRLGIEQEWFDYKEARLLDVARGWCAENGVAWAYRFPERMLARRRFAEAEVEAAKDAPVGDGDETFNGGFFKFNYTTLTAEIEREGHELEEVELDVDLWLGSQGGDEPKPPEGYELWREPLLLEISPDHRLVAPDNDHALLYCCALIDAPIWLHAAKREGRKTIRARLVPMEVHERHICRGRAQYMAHWNSKCNDMMGYAKRKRERGQR